MSRARGHFHPTFVTDIRAHQDWIVERGEASWLDSLAAGLDDASALLADFPEVGRVVVEGQDTAVRRLLWSYGPYVCWYVHRRGSAVRDVWLIRLFHARQRRSVPGVRFWGDEIERPEA